jgi:intein/homing endonuclease
VCLPPGEEVVVNGSIKKIEEIGIAEKVLTSNGCFQNINQIISQKYCGRIRKIKTRFFTEPVTLTANHPVLTAEIRKIPHRKIQIANKLKWKQAKELTVGDVVLYPIILGIKDIQKIQFSKILGVEVKNGKVKNDQETYTSKRLSDVIPLNKKFLRLVGYYLAEGSVGRQETYFDFNFNEKEYIKDVKRMIKELFSLKVNIKKKKRVTRLIVSSRLFRDLFYILFGKSAPSKKIPHWMLFLPKEKQKELIKGLFRGHGCIKERNFELTTSSRTLAYQVRDILLRFKIIAGIDRREKEKLNKTPGDIGGRKIRFNYDRYHLRIGGSSLKKMSEVLNIHHPLLDKRKMTCRHAWIKGKHLYLPIREITSGRYKGRVYNLVTEKNNTYVAKNFIVHNCDGPLFEDKTVAVIGGGNAGFEAAIFLANYAKKIYILEYAPRVRADLVIQEMARKTGKIQVITSAVLKKINGNQFVNSIIYQDKKTKKDINLPVEGVFVEIGNQPATSFVKDLVDFNEKDEIKVDYETCQTKTEGLFAAGDVNVGPFKQIITACGEGAKAALSAYQYLTKYFF